MNQLKEAKVSVEADDTVAAVRAFSRFYTNVIGVLREGLLDTPHSLTEARVVFELAQGDATELVDLRRRLDIDAGYLSRIVARFEADGIASREQSEADRRRQVIRLTDQGRAVFNELDERSAAQVRTLLAPLTDDDRRRLVGAMGAIEQVLESAPRNQPFLLRPPEPGDFGWIVQRHGALYAEEFGWDETFEALVARIVSDYLERRDPQREAAWIAEVDGERAGCVLCTKKEEKVAQLRLLLVEPRGRGMGVGTRLVEECLRFARRSGYERIMLWTNDVLTDARRIYERAGFELVEEESHQSFGHDLVGQNWWRRL
jgi:DNA-binding MarR family transcriptional regulator/N-acetylglutamate synthase-like GNAT family acetyltransferase